MGCLVRVPVTTPHQQSSQADCAIGCVIQGRQADVQMRDGSGLSGDATPSATGTVLLMRFDTLEEVEVAEAELTLYAPAPAMLRALAHLRSDSVWVREAASAAGAAAPDRLLPSTVTAAGDATPPAGSPATKRGRPLGRRLLPQSYGALGSGTGDAPPGTSQERSAATPGHTRLVGIRVPRVPLTRAGAAAKKAIAAARRKSRPRIRKAELAELLGLPAGEQPKFPMQVLFRVSILGVVQKSSQQKVGCGRV